MALFFDINHKQSYDCLVVKTRNNKGDGTYDKDKDCFIYWELRIWLCSVHTTAVQSYPSTKTYP